MYLLAPAYGLRGALFGSVLTPKAKILIWTMSPTIVLCVVGLIPLIVKRQCTACRDACIANLKQMDGAKATWALGTKPEFTNDPLEQASWSTNSLSRTNAEGR